MQLRPVVPVKGQLGSRSGRVLIDSISSEERGKRPDAKGKLCLIVRRVRFCSECKTLSEGEQLVESTGLGENEGGGV